MVCYLIVESTGSDEEWHEDATVADAAVARRLGITADQVESQRRRITVDPVVVRRDGARWRSRQAWTVRSGDTAVRVFEMLEIDEALYEH